MDNLDRDKLWEVKNFAEPGDYEAGEIIAEVKETESVKP